MLELVEEATKLTEATEPLDELLKEVAGLLEETKDPPEAEKLVDDVDWRLDVTKPELELWDQENPYVELVGVAWIELLLLEDPERVLFPKLTSMILVASWSVISV